MLHDISAFEFITNIADTYPTGKPTNTPNKNNTTLLANAASLYDTKLSPADIRKVLSTTNSNNHTNQKDNSTSNHCATVAIDGIKYRQCNTHTRHIKYLSIITNHVPH